MINFDNEQFKHVKHFMLEEKKQTRKHIYLYNITDVSHKLTKIEQESL